MDFKLKLVCSKGSSVRIKTFAVLASAHDYVARGYDGNHSVVLLLEVVEERVLC